MTDVGGIAQDVLRSFVERIERLEEEKKNYADDIKDVYSEAKSSGFDAKVLRQIVRMRKMEDHDRQEQEALVDLYAHALGMLRGLSSLLELIASTIFWVRASDRAPCTTIIAWIIVMPNTKNPPRIKNINPNNQNTALMIA